MSKSNNNVIDIIDRIKKSQFYEIDVSFAYPYKLPKNVPFEVLINDGEAKFKVLAPSEEEAYMRVFDYLNSLDDDPFLEDLQ